jgi:hypothetical protein
MAAVGCRDALFPADTGEEPAPPLVEPNHLAPESRLVEPRADALIQAMSERLDRADALAFEADEVYGDVPEQSPRQQPRVR